MDIFVSNGFMRSDVVTSIETLIKNNFRKIELSNGLCDASTLNALKLFRKQGIELRLHNYFPNIGTPFVLNLASADSDVVNRSKDLIQKALEWSSELNASYYAFHAGFRLSPHIDELGGNLNQHTLMPLDETKDRFLSELSHLSVRACELGVTIAVENNVYDSKNYDVFGSDNPLLLTGSVNTDLDLPSDVGILLDFGHLNVSAFTEKFDKISCIHRWSGKINGYHISDNNQLFDSNSVITNDSWFWEHINKSVTNITLEVYEENLDKLSDNVTLLESFYDN